MSLQNDLLRLPVVSAIQHALKSHPLYRRFTAIFLFFSLLAALSFGFDMESYKEPSLQGLQFLLYVGLFIAAVQWAPTQRLLSRVSLALQPLAHIPRRVFLCTCFALVLLLCLHLSWALFQHIPHVNDTINQYINAKFLAAGQWTGKAHPLQEFFQVGWMFNDNGRIYAPYSPAPIMLLAIGHLLQAPWLINPLSGALTVVATYFLARELYNEATAKLGTFLACASPLIMFMSSEYMNHAFTLLCATLFMLYFIRTLKTASYASAALAGVFLGLIFLTRPFTALGICIPYVMMGLWCILRSPNTHFWPLLLSAGVFSISLVLHAAYNIVTTGDPMVMAYYKMIGPRGMPGFHQQLELDDYGNIHTLANAIMFGATYFALINRMLFEWAIPSMFFVFVLVIAGKIRRLELLLAATFISLLLTYATFAGQHLIFGPRYIYESSSALIVLTAGALQRIPILLRRVLNMRFPLSALHGASALLVMSLIAMAAFTSWPARYNSYATHYWEGNVDYFHYTQRDTEKPALVFVPTRRNYFRVAFENPPADEAPVVYAFHHGPRNVEVMRYYPYRNSYAMSRGLLTPIATPYTLCLGWTRNCDHALRLLHETYGLETIPTCAHEPDAQIPSVIFPTNTTLNHSLCSGKWNERFNDVVP